MDLFRRSNLFIIRLLFLIAIIGHDTIELDLHQMTQSSDFHQITSFISENLTITPGLQLLHNTPAEINSFDPNNNRQKQIHANALISRLENRYSLEKSLIVFYTSNLSQVEYFIDFLVPQLSVAHQRPKCAIVNLRSKNYENNHEIDVIRNSKYAWKKKILGFFNFCCDRCYRKNIYRFNIFILDLLLEPVK